MGKRFNIGKRYGERLTVSLSPVQVERIQRMAVENNKTISEIVRCLIDAAA